MKGMSNFAVLCARAVRVDGYTAALLTSLLASQYTLKEYQSRSRVQLHVLVVSVTNS